MEGFPPRIIGSFLNDNSSYLLAPRAFEKCARAGSLKNVLARCGADLGLASDFLKQLAALSGLFPGPELCS